MKKPTVWNLQQTMRILQWKGRSSIHISLYWQNSSYFEVVSIYRFHQSFLANQWTKIGKHCVPKFFWVSCCTLKVYEQNDTLELAVTSILTIQQKTNKDGKSKCKQGKASETLMSGRPKWRSLTVSEKSWYNWLKNCNVRILSKVRKENSLCEKRLLFKMISF